MAGDRLRGVEVRRHNGQNPYGAWATIDDADLPPWVAEMVADAVAEEPRARSGRVERGGSIWLWRKGD